MTEYLVVTFKSTFDAMDTEARCREHNVKGRLIPLPADIHADCGLAWRMLPEEETAFDEAVCMATDLSKKAPGWKPVMPAGRYRRQFRY